MAVHITADTPSNSMDQRTIFTVDNTRGRVQYLLNRMCFAHVGDVSAETLKSSL